MEHASRELLSGHVILTILTSGVVLACMFAVVGPIGFYRVTSPFPRVLSSILYTLLCLPLFYGVTVLLLCALRFRSPLAILAGLGLATPVGAFQCTAVIHTIENLVHAGYPPEVGFLEVFLKVTSTYLACMTLFFYVVWQRTTRTRRLALHADGGRGTPAADRGAGEAAPPPDGGAVPAGDRAAAADAPDERAEAQVLPRNDRADAQQTVPGAQQPAASRTPSPGSTLLNLLPDRLGTDLVFIKSEDHYLEVHTTVGSSLIKMRFSDAVAELGDRGMQIHRSYWVATGHVVRTARNGKRTTLRLTGDREVPVSVTHLRAVRALLDR